MAREDEYTRAIVSALRGMEDFGPEDLLEAVNHKLKKSNLTLAEQDLVEILTEGDLNGAERRDFHFALARWDAEPEADWARGLPRASQPRRDRVLDLIGFGEDSRARISAAFPPFLDTDVVILDPDWEPWYSPERQRQNHFYWKAYEGVLKGGMTPEAVSSIDAVTTNIVSRLADPTAAEPYQSKGLVVGHVQSGKTANFTGVIAKAIDAGYRVVIVLTGTIELLRAQTQRRLDMELIGEENILGGRDKTDPVAVADIDYAGDGDLDWVEGRFLKHNIDFGMSPGIPAIRRLTGRTYDYKRLAAGLDALDFRTGNELRNPRLPVWHKENLFDTDVRIAVVKKNKAVLTKLVQDLRNVRAKLDEIPVLIIDDEADQASVNTINPSKPKSAESIERTAINGLIAELLGELKRSQYVGYTATPFANVFVSPEDSEDIFPKDFIISLNPPTSYMGGQAFHDLGGLAEADKGDPEFSNEAAFVRSLRAVDHEKAALELRSAIDMFVLTGAVKLWRANADPSLSFEHHTMLVHESVRTIEHRELAATIRNLWSQASYSSAAAKIRLRELFLDDIVRVSHSRSWEAPLPDDFDDLTPFIGQAVDLIMVRRDPVVVVNGDKESDYEELDFQKGRVWRILVGGAKLSRGYTVEGLTVTYYRRRALQADSLMQMGRWFGYRTGYRDLVRLFIARNVNGPRQRTYDLYEAFQAIVEDEEDFRAQLRKFSELDGSGQPMIRPIEVPPLVFQQLPWLKPTSPNKMYNAELDFIGEGGTLKDFPRQPERGKSGEHNRRHFSAFNDWLLRLGGETEFEYLDTNEKRGTFIARTVVVSAEEMLVALAQFHWVDGFSFSPTVEMLRRAIGEHTLTDWAVMVPYLGNPPTIREVEGASVPVVKRTRRDGTRGGFSGSSFRQRDAIQHIAGNPRREGGPNADALHTPTRGAMLLTFAADPANDDRDPRNLPAKVPAGDVATLFSLALPRLAAPHGRIGFRVRDMRHKNQAIVPAEIGADMGHVDDDPVSWPALDRETTELTQYGLHRLAQNTDGDDW